MCLGRVWVGQNRRVVALRRRMSAEVVSPGTPGAILTFDYKGV
jgi:hypothetical protein